MRLPIGTACSRSRPPSARAVSCPPADLPGAPAAANADFEAAVKPVLQRSCYACHNAKLKNADVNLEAYETSASITRDPQTWEKAVVKMRTGQMPPPGLPRPDEAEVAAITGWIEKEIEQADHLARPNPGRVTARRLNRTEYDNTVRDLLGVSLRPAADFPQDDSGYGFDNIGDVLSLSPVLMEKYMTAAERVARGALFGPEDLKPTLVRHQPGAAKISPSPTPLLEYDVTGLSLPNALHVIDRVPVEGEYLFRVVLGGARPAGSEPLEIGLWIDGRQIGVLDLDPEGGASFFDDRQDYSGKTREFRARVAAGDHWVAASVVRLYEGLPASYGGPRPSKRPVPPPPEFKPRESDPPEKVEEARKRFEARLAEKAPVNEARVHHLEIVGPFEPVRGPSAASLQKVYVCGHLRGGHGRGCARSILTSLARRAYRRPVTASDVDPLVRLASRARKQGDSFEEALRIGLAGRPGVARFPVPHREGRRRRRLGYGAPHRPARAGVTPVLLPLGHHAGRRALDRCADSRDPAATRGPGRTGAAHVEGREGRRPRRGLRRPVAPVPGPRVGERPTPSASRPSRTTFACRCGERRSCSSRASSGRTAASSTSSTASYSFLNERLARHYGVPGVTGPEFRRVDLTGTPRERGLDPGERADRVVLRDPNLARAARQMDPREPPGRAPARPAGGNAEAGRGQGRLFGLAPAADGGPPDERDLRGLPLEDGPARASVSRTTTPSARGGPRTASLRSTLPARFPTDGRSRDPPR